MSALTPATGPPHAVDLPTYPDLRRRFRRALESLLPAAAIFPLVVVLEELEEYASCGQVRSGGERKALDQIEDALLAYREAYHADRGSVGSEELPEQSRWEVFLFLAGVSAVGGATVPPPAPPKGTPESIWPRWVRAWVAAGCPARADGDQGWVRDFHAGTE